MLRAGIGATLLLVLGMSAAHAEDLYFRSPSGNIYCGYFSYDGQTAIRCDIRAFTPSYKRPADCDLDYGGAFEITPNANRGSVLCYGDTVMSPDARVLAYGRSIDRGGMTCVSAQTGMTCTNAKGHGFSIARAKQKVF